MKPEIKTILDSVKKLQEQPLMANEHQFVQKVKYYSRKLFIEEQPKK